MFKENPSIHSQIPQEVWLDGRNVGRKNGTGVHYYALNHQRILQESGFKTAWLLENTNDRPLQSGFIRFLKALCYPQPRISCPFSSEWGEAHLARDLYRIAHVHYRYRGHILKLRPTSPPDIMHWTYPLPILMEGCANLVTIHDLIPLTHPHLTRIKPDKFHRLIQDLINNDVHFITVSETVRHQMLSLFHINPERITTLYQPVQFDAPTKEAIIRAPQIVPENSFIFYGRIEHRKNIERLLDAHAISNTETPLVLIGPDGDDKPDCRPRNPRNKVIRLPWCDRLSLLRALKEAKALLFPSLAEGFGLPIIEAMALDVPVLTSHGGVTEEIAGDAAFLCDAMDVADLAQTIQKLDVLSPLERQKITEKGRIRADFFSNTAYQKRFSLFMNDFQKK